MNTTPRPTPAAARARLAGRSAAVIALSYYPWDPRIRRETEALADSGLRVDVFCLRETAAEPTRETLGRVTVHRLGLERHRAGKLRYIYEYAVFFLWAFWRVSLGACRHRYALAHVHNVPDALVFTTLGARLLGARVILDLHDPMPELYRTIYGLGPRHPLVLLLVALEWLALHYASVVLTPNRGFRRLFVRRSGLRRKVRIVMNTPDERIFDGAAAVGATPGRFRLMYHGLIAERHGLDLLVRAVQLLVPFIPGLELDIYGARTPFLDEVEALSLTLGLSSVVHCHGKRPLAEIAAIIPTIDLGIVPNRRTPFTELNFPTRIFEYLAFRKPVVTLHTRGVRDYFAPDELLFFPRDDPAALAAAIRRAHADPAATAATVARGFRVYDRHRWSAERTRFVTLVERTLAHRAAAPLLAPPSLSPSRTYSPRAAVPPPVSPSAHLLS